MRRHRVVPARAHVPMDLLVGSFKASVGSIGKIAVLAVAFAALQKRQKLDSSAVQQLSAVSFQAVLPLMLAVRLASTLASSSSSSSGALGVLAVPACALFQIAIGAAAASLLLRIAHVDDRRLALACGMYANTFTVPSVMLQSTCSSPAELSTCLATVALFLVGWSPALWSAGVAVLEPNAWRSSHHHKIEKADMSLHTRILNAIHCAVSDFTTPPLWGAFAGIFLGCFPGTRDGFLPPASAGSDLEGKSGVLGAAAQLLSWSFRNVVDAASLVGSSAVGLQAIVLSGSLANSFLREGNGLRSALPTSRELKALVPILFARMLVTPALSLAAVWALHSSGFGVLAPGTREMTYTVLVISGCPPAQNLSLISQITPSASLLAPRVARLIFTSYVACALPMAAWIALFRSVVSNAATAA